MTATGPLPLRLLLWTVLGCLAAAPVHASGQDIAFARDAVEIVTQDGRSHTFRVDLAVTPRQRAHGLMFRRSMAADEGMLFLFDRERQRSFWMKNTFLALDMIFLDRSGVIVRIARDTVPLDETSIRSRVPAFAVLEVLAGTARRLGLQVGDRVRHRGLTGDEDP